MKKKTSFLSLLLFLFTTQAMAQENQRKYQLGFGIFPNFSRDILTTDLADPFNLLPSLSRNETYKASISTTVFIEYQLGEKSRFGIGLGFQNNGDRLRSQANNRPVFQGYPVDPSYPIDVRVTYNHYNIELPLYYKRYLGEKAYFVVGTSGIINLSNTESFKKIYSNKRPETKTIEDRSTDYRTFNFSANLGIGKDVYENEKFTCFVLPYIQYGILGMSKAAPINRHFFSIGVSLGIRL
ncbi:outer membrane beta-barrel protein [bacterium]|nr:outer membrane beta-barrel protein [bacterium]